MGRNENIAIFKDTKEFCGSNDRLRESVRKSTEEQKLILEKDDLTVDKKDIYETSAKVVVSKKRTLEAAKAYKNQRVAVHNFASATNPGGGVERGANAQEECLCRCSSLFLCLNDNAMNEGFYKPHKKARDPIHNDDIIYTPRVTVFKTDTSEPKLMPENEWYDVDVITCAAPNLREHPSNQYNSGDGSQQAVINDEDLLNLHEKRLRRMLDVAILEGADTVILGAFGCGAFKNNPEIVARAYHNVIREYLHAFKNIEFAVYCSPRSSRNYKIFEETLKEFSC